MSKAQPELRPLSRACPKCGGLVRSDINEDGRRMTAGEHTRDYLLEQIASGSLELHCPCGGSWKPEPEDLSQIKNNLDFARSQLG